MVITPKTAEQAAEMIRAVCVGREFVYSGEWASGRFILEGGLDRPYGPGNVSVVVESGSTFIIVCLTGWCIIIDSCPAIGVEATIKETPGGVSYTVRQPGRPTRGGSFLRG